MQNLLFHRENQAWCPVNSTYCWLPLYETHLILNRYLMMFSRSSRKLWKTFLLLWTYAFSTSSHWLDRIPAKSCKQTGCARDQAEHISSTFLRRAQPPTIEFEQINKVLTTSRGWSTYSQPSLPGSGGGVPGGTSGSGSGSGSGVDFPFLPPPRLPRDGAGNRPEG